MTSLSKSYNHFLAEYKSWVRRNPKKVKHIENYSVFLLSLFAGKISNSEVPYDWISSIVKLLAFVNNNILHSYNDILTNNSDKIKLFITVLEYFEVTFERTVQHLWGERKKWRLIVISQCIKSISKLGLLLFYKEKLICSPYAILNQNRESVIFDKIDTGGMSSVCQDNYENAFVLKRSGRVVRKGCNGLLNNELLYPRTWEPPILHNRREIDIKQFSGELLYIVKPLLNLLVMKKYGYGTWKPWLFSLVMDIASIHLIHNPTHRRNAVERFPLVEREEMTKRRYLLLLYLLRSPFYERHTEKRLKTLLRLIPLIGLISIRQLDMYLPMYSTFWSK